MREIEEIKADIAALENGIPAHEIIGFKPLRIKADLPTMKEYGEKLARLNSELLTAITADIPDLEALCNAWRENRCVVLPCKVGDTVYVIPSEVNWRLNAATKLSANNRVYEQKVESIRFFKASDWTIATCDGMEIHRSDAFGKTVFLTREAADAALKEAGE